MIEHLQTDEASHSRPDDWIRTRLTVERALYVGIGLTALALRLYTLGQRPMQPQEAHQALAAWQLLQGQPAQTTGSSPLILTGNLLAFALLGASDTAARLLPALLGTTLVLLPYALRRWLGREGALFASALLALSPVALFNARYVSGATAVGVSALLLAAGASHWMANRERQSLYWGLGGLVGLLLADTAGYTILLVFGSFPVFLALATQRSVWRETGPGPSLVSRLQSSMADWEALPLRRAAILFGLAVGLTSTCFLLNPGGLQATLDLFPRWLSGFAPSPDGLSWPQYLALLPIYEPVALIFGLASLAVSWREQDLFSTFLSYWTLAVLVITGLMAGREVGDALLVVLPLVLLSARFLGRRVPKWVGTTVWGQEGVLVALACALAIHAGLQLSFYSLNSETIYPQAIGLTSLLIIGLFASAAHWLGRDAAFRGAGLFVLLTLGLSMTSAGIHLNFAHPGDPHELTQNAPTSVEVNTLLSDVARLSTQRDVDERAVDIALHEDLALPLAWYLRDYPNTRIVQALGPTIDSTAVIAPATEEDAALGGPYRGQDYVMRSLWNLGNLDGDDLGAWLLRREASTPLQEERAILWVRQEEN